MSFSHQALAEALESRIRQRRLIDLAVDWADELVYPAYDSLSIRNIAHTIADCLGVTLPNHEPLDAAIWDRQSLADVDRVVLFLSDGLGYQYLQALLNMDGELSETVAQLTDGRGAVPLTSVVPSTTAVALPTMWTGAEPASHGILGTLMYLREFSMLVNMLFYRPQIGKDVSDVIARRISPKDFVPLPGLGEHLAEQGIPTHLLIHKSLAGTGLSRILHRGVSHRHRHSGYSDMWLRLHDLLRDTAGKRCYVSVYYGAVDTLSHDYGARNHYTHHEIKTQLQTLVELLNQPDVQDGRTLFLFTADHGHADITHTFDVQKDDVTDVIRQSLRSGIAGDMRLPHLHLYQGTLDAVQATVEAHYADRFAFVESKTALEAGLYGNHAIADTARSRLGDGLLIPRLGWEVTDTSVGELSFASTHTGLHEDEMLVPLLWKTL